MTDTKIDFGDLEGNIETPDRNSSFERKGLASVKIYYLQSNLTSYTYQILLILSEFHCDCVLYL
jgi:hypothetical protein